MGESKRKKTKQPAQRSSKHVVVSSKKVTDVMPDQAAAEVPFKQSSSWALFKPSASLWFKNSSICTFLFVLPPLFLALGSQLVPEIDPLDGWRILGLVSMIIGFVLILINAPASIYMQTRVIHGATPGIAECYRGALRHIFRLVGLAGLLTVLILIGLLFFIVPGLIFIRRYALAPYYLIDHDLGIRQAMQRSAADSKPVSKYIWSLITVNAIVATVSLLLFVKIFPPYGSLIAYFIITLYTLAPALRYREVALHRPAADLIEA